MSGGDTPQKSLTSHTLQTLGKRRKHLNIFIYFKFLGEGTLVDPISFERLPKFCIDLLLDDQLE